VEKTIRKEIIRFVEESTENRLPPKDYRIFDAPLVGFSLADDPIFTSYQSIIGPFHLTPQEMYSQAAGDAQGRAGSVISWILPVSENIRKSNRKENYLPSREWAQCRTYGEKFNDALGRHMVDFLASLGAHAVVPKQSPAMRIVKDPRVGFASAWSERHVAFAAGLGSFSLNCGFITERGIAVTCGSIITDLVLEPSLRVSNEPWGNCLYFQDGSCGLCIKRCPVGAISGAGLDKLKCYSHAYGTAPNTVGKVYGLDKTGCGLCQTRVPCESLVPRRGGDGRGIA